MRYVPPIEEDHIFFDTPALKPLNGYAPRGASSFSGTKGLTFFSFSLFVFLIK
jgi:hypothetical protein